MDTRATYQRLDKSICASRRLSSFADRDCEEIEHDFSTDHAFSVTRGKTFFNCILLVFPVPCSPVLAGSPWSPSPYSFMRTEGSSLGFDRKRPSTAEGAFARSSGRTGSLPHPEIKEEDPGLGWG